MGKNLQFRRGSKANLPKLLDGEPAYSLDSKELNIGNTDKTISTFIDKAATEQLIVTEVGDKTLLKTTSKATVVGALNEIYDRTDSTTHYGSYFTKRGFKSYIAQSQTNSFPIVDAAPGDIVDVILENLILIENVDYVIDRDYTKIDLMNHTLENGDIIYYAVYQTSPNVFMKAASKGTLTTPVATNTIIIPNMTEQDYCRLYYQGLTLEEALSPADPRQYSITSSGVVTFTFNLAPGDYVYYEVFKRTYDFNDLCNVPTSVSNYTLPPATTTELGGIKIGTNLSVSADGTLNIDSSKIPVPTHTHLAKDIPDLNNTPFELEPATDSRLGGVKAGYTLNVSADGTLNVNANTIVPIATNETLGSVKIGDGLTITPDGVVGLDPEAIYVPDHMHNVEDLNDLSLLIDYTLPPATSNDLGGIKVGKGLKTSLDGTLDIDIDYILTILNNAQI